MYNAGQIEKDKKIARIARYGVNPKRCKKCDAALPYEKRKNVFCSQSCSSSHNNLGVCRREKRVRTPCAICGLLTSVAKSKYCSPKCLQVAKWTEKKLIIEHTGSVPKTQTGDPRGAKRYLLETRGQQCEICGITEWTEKPVPVILDHIDGNSDNWKLNNLRLVCPNCDALLPTYKNKNRGNGRASRRKRYAQGKSY
jgi:hypothetical protein